MLMDPALVIHRLFDLLGMTASSLLGIWLKNRMDTPLHFEVSEVAWLTINLGNRRRGVLGVLKSVSYRKAMCIRKAHSSLRSDVYNISSQNWGRGILNLFVSKLDHHPI